MRPQPPDDPANRLLREYELLARTRCRTAPLGVLGDYRLRRYLAKGGFAYVVQAVDAAHGGRPVAIKLLQRRHCDRPALREQFLAEGRLGMALSRPQPDPHLVEVLAVGEMDDGDPRTPYIAMEYMEHIELGGGALGRPTLGQAMRDWWAGPEGAEGTVDRRRGKRRGTDPQVAAAVIWQAALGVARLHRHEGGYVHNDLHPENVLLTTCAYQYLANRSQRGGESYPVDIVQDFFFGPCCFDCIKVIDLSLARPAPGSPAAAGTPADTALDSTVRDSLAIARSRWFSVREDVGIPEYMAPELFRLLEMEALEHQEHRGEAGGAAVAQARRHRRSRLHRWQDWLDRRARRFMGERLSPASDVYSLGAMLFELLTGSPPFVGNRSTIPLMVERNEPLFPPDSAIPAELQLICLCALTREPRYRRYRDAGELASDLEQFLTEERKKKRALATPAAVPSSPPGRTGPEAGAKAETAPSARRGDLKARPLSVWERTVRWGLHRPWRALAATASLALILVAACAALLLTWLGMNLVGAQEELGAVRGEVEAGKNELDQMTSQLADDRRKQEGLSRQVTEAQSKLASEKAEVRTTAEFLKRLRYDARVFQSHGQWSKYQVAEAKERLRQCPPELGGWEYGYLTRLYWGTTERLGGHGSQVFNVAFDTSGKRLAAATSQFTTDPKQPNGFGNVGEVRIWDIATRNLLQVVRIEDRQAIAVAWAPDAKLLAIAGGSQGKPGSVTVIDPETGKVRWGRQGQEESIQCLAFSQDGKRVAAGDDDGKVIVWDAGKGDQICRFKASEESVTAIAFLGSGDRLANAGIEGSLTFWDLSQGPPGTPKRLRRHKFSLEQNAWYDALLFISSTSELAAAGRDGHVLLFDTAGTAVAAIWGPNKPIACLACDATGQEVTTGCDDGSVFTYDRKAILEKAAFRGPLSRLGKLAVRPDGRKITAGGDGVSGASVDLFYARQNLEFELTIAEKATYRGPFSRLRTLAVSPDGHRIAAGGDGASGMSVVLFDARRNQEFELGCRHERTVRGLAFSPDGKTLASDGDTTVRLWDLVSGKPRENGSLAHPGNVVDLAWSDDGQWLAVASEGQRSRDPSEVRVWDVAKGRLARRWTSANGGHVKKVTQVAFNHPKSPEAPLVVVSGGEDGTLVVWDVQAGKKIKTLEPHKGRITGIGFSPDRETLVTAGWDGIRLWSTEDWRVLRPFGKSQVFSALARGHFGSITGIALSRDGKWLASTEGDEILVWDLADAAAAPTALIGHVKDVTSVAFSPDGSRLFSLAKDRTVLVWDISTQEAILSLKGEEGGVLAVSPDGWRLATGGEEGQVRIYDGSPLPSPVLLTARKQFAHGLTFHQDGRRLAWIGDLTPAGASMAPPPGGRSALPDPFPALGPSELVQRDWKDFRFAERFQRDGFTFHDLFVTPGQDVGAAGWELEKAMQSPLAGGYRSSQLRIWNVTQGKELAPLQGHPVPWHVLAVSPSGRYAAIAAGGTVYSWDREASAKEPRELLSLRGIVRFLRFSDDNRRLLAITEGLTAEAINNSKPEALLNAKPEVMEKAALSDVAVFDVAAGDEKFHRTLTGEWILDGALSSDGGELALLRSNFSQPSKLELIDVAAKKTRLVFDVEPLKEGKVFRRLVYHAARHWAALGQEGGAVTLWDTEKGSLLRTFHEQDLIIVDLRFSADGRWLASSSTDGTVRVHDLSQFIR